MLTQYSFFPPQSFEHVLANINKLNRNLEAVITVGNEFSSVEALWSTFENVMGKPVPTTGDNKTAAAAATATAEDDDEQGEVEQQQGQQRQGTPGKRKRGNDAGGDREGQNEEKDL